MVEYKITIQIAMQFLGGRERDMPQETIEVLHFVLMESPSLNLRLTQMGLPLNIDICATSLMKLVDEFLNIVHTSRPLSQRDGVKIKKALRGVPIETSQEQDQITRDGVSEGQFSYVPLHEMDAITKACASLEEGYLPPVTFVAPSPAPCQLASVPALASLAPSATAVAKKVQQNLFALETTAMATIQEGKDGVTDTTPNILPDTEMEGA